MEQRSEVGQLLYYLTAAHMKHLSDAREERLGVEQHPRQLLGVFMESGMV